MLTTKPKPTVTAILQRVLSGKLVCPISYNEELLTETTLTEIKEGSPRLSLQNIRPVNGVAEAYFRISTDGNGSRDDVAFSDLFPMVAAYISDADQKKLFLEKGAALWLASCDYEDEEVSFALAAALSTYTKKILPTLNVEDKTNFLATNPKEVPAVLPVAAPKKRKAIDISEPAVSQPFVFEKLEKPIALVVAPENEEESDSEDVFDDEDDIDEEEEVTPTVDAKPAAVVKKSAVVSVDKKKAVVAVVTKEPEKPKRSRSKPAALSDPIKNVEVSEVLDKKAVSCAHVGDYVKSRALLSYNLLAENNLLADPIKDKVLVQNIIIIGMYPKK